MKVRPTDVIHESWKPYLPILKDKSFTKPLMQLKNKSPEWSQVFRAFSIPIDEVRACITGLSPYQRGLANGIAFSSSVDTPSLEMIRENLAWSYNDLFIENHFDNELSHWVDDGVLLINAALTVPSTGNVRAHLDLWYPFISRVVEVCSDTLRIPVWLMGKDAQIFEKDAQFMCLKSCHPVVTKYAMSRGKVPEHLDFRLSPNFKLINQHIEKMNGKEYTINWTGYENI